MTPVKILVPGIPQGKGRARAFIRRGGRGAGTTGHYTPEKTRSYEGVIAAMAQAAMAGRALLTAPLLIEVIAVMPVPPSWPAWKRAAALRGEVLPTTKPDLDNIEKALKDGFNQVVWRDDAQVVHCVKSKRYGDTPGVMVTVTPSGALSAQDKRRTA